MIFTGPAPAACLGPAGRPAPSRRLPLSPNAQLDVSAQVFRYQESQWKNWYEVFSVCRSCHTPTIFLISLLAYDAEDKLSKSNSLVESKNALNNYFEVNRYILLRDNSP